MEGRDRLCDAAAPDRDDDDGGDDDDDDDDGVAKKNIEPKNSEYQSRSREYSVRCFS